MRIFKSGACTAIMLSISALAHAQAASAPQASVRQLASAQVSQADAPVTRAQVRHELVHAERDGQIQTLDRTLYAHH
ncbi:DUF4148 domain-containing protein [Paraburkholderia heleia]|uniref:DUF4148 domain-containing protein n=1 Tax=Paraburkholderia heleia TaxID=634127 RepID=UPI000B17EE31|nr:DUF4148 domain-containing protein [Paraburkholderia heleia]